MTCHTELSWLVLFLQIVVSVRTLWLCGMGAFSLFQMRVAMAGRRGFPSSSAVRVIFQATDSLALVVLYSLRHAPRRHCL